MRGVVFLIFAAGVCSAQVQNAADVNIGPFSVNLAQGSLAAIQFSQTTDTPITSATVSLLPVNSTTPFAATVTSIAPFTIKFVVPAEMPLGPAQLIYKPGAQATQWTSVNIVPASLSLYRTGAVGPLIAENGNPDGSLTPNGLTTPAQPGQPVVLWGSGLGATPESQVQITLGGVTQPVVFAGASPGTPGLSQINFSVASGTPDGCYLPLVVTYGTQSVTSFLSKTSDGMPCHHPWGLSAQAMQLLDSGTSVEVGEITLATAIEAASSDRASRQESAQLAPIFLNASQIAAYFSGTATSSAQPCSIQSNSSYSFSLLEGGFGPIGTTTLVSANNTLSLPWTSSPPSDSPLASLPPAVIAAGSWTWNTGSATGVPPSISFPFVLPPPIQLSGGAPIAINHTQAATIGWNGARYDSNAVVNLTLRSQPILLPSLTCSVPAQAGSVTIPASLLAQFTAGSSGFVGVTVTENGPGIPAGNFTMARSPFLALVLWNSSDARPVDFQ